MQLLNKQECQVIAYLADGLTHEQIGKKLEWSELTVESRLEEMMRKLNMSHSYQLISWAYLEGVLK
ncbi:response regulator transcription factor [Pontibacter ummariensis]|uniref:response regulator transcription factor n=1 Tax=Pontibacter ummariensis TaxID=1610492 RepID=UPI0015C66F68|nr:LuxR C-terminal-related transcriptional regulator [Pontibacter ummariensis]